MNSIIKLLHHSFVTPYYRQITGAILFIFFVLFGINPSFRQALETNYYIILSITQTPQAFLVFCGFLLLYATKCISFFSGRVNTNGYQFIFQLNGIASAKRTIALTYIAVMLLLPALIYGLLVIIIGFINLQHTYALFCLCALTIITVFTTVFYSWLTHHPEGLKTGSIKLLPQIKFPKTISWFLIRFMFRKQFRALLFVKLLSFMALYFFVVHDASVFEERMLWLIFTLCLIAHGVIIYKNFYFLETELQYYRNLPIANGKIILQLLIAYLLIYLPEIWALRALWLVHGNLYSYICMVIGGPAILALLHTLLYTDDMSMDSFLPLLFGIWLLFFFFSFSQNKWLIPFVSLFGCIVVFYTSFRSFEKQGEVENLE